MRTKIRLMPLWEFRRVLRTTDRPGNLAGQPGHPDCYIGFSVRSSAFAVHRHL
jgi:hypothetical protein